MQKINLSGNDCWLISGFTNIWKFNLNWLANPQKLMRLIRVENDADMTIDNIDLKLAEKWNVNLFSSLINNSRGFSMKRTLSLKDEQGWSHSNVFQSHNNFNHATNISVLRKHLKLTFNISRVGSSSGVSASDDFLWPSRPLVGALAAMK